MDTLTGTAGNDTFIADNTDTTKLQSSIADSINGGAGTDTLKLFVASGVTSVSASTLPTLNSVENVAINGGTLTSVNVAAIAGVTGVALDSTIQGPGATTNTITVAGQTVSLSNTIASAATTSTSAGGGAAITAAAAATARTATTTIASAADTAANVTLNKFVNGTHTNVNTDTTVTGGITTVTTSTTTQADIQILNIAGAKVATLNVTTTGAASNFTLASGTALKTLTIAGDKALTLTTDAASSAAITTINASTATGAVTVDTSAGTKAAAFAFTGGAGNDKLTLKIGDLAALTAGSQLDGGAGTDTLVINDTTLTAGIFTALNATKGFEVLGLGATGASVDAAQLTTIKAFSFGGVANETISNLGTGSTVTITGAITGAVTLGAALGNTATDVTLGAATTAGFTVATLSATGLTTLNLTSNGTSANTITTLTNSDNTTLTIKGAADLTITDALAGTTTGSKVDASAFTGKLVVIGSGVADILIGGSNDDVLTAGGGADILTGGAGKDKFVVTGSGITVAAADIITDFTTKVDTISFGNGTAAVTATFTKAIAVVADFAAALAAANAVLTTGTAGGAGQYNVQQIGADAFVFYNDGAVAGADQVIKLTGVALANVAFGDIVA
ncbi:beta strand repeat-containing protein [Rhodoferax antarcticus]|uniref:beta strand repeat-containing protein n=1 Tax=Rhodoferax antarcticus TaxID=81479 RepID=UPI0022247171|nr:calcium-binding protein [Rhodoferax antarcticus]MCW2314319.1 Ca2+-binding RTX toxin-like protein [Rhodoferax antarcticus]